MKKSLLLPAVVAAAWAAIFALVALPAHADFLAAGFGGDIVQRYDSRTGSLIGTLASDPYTDAGTFVGDFPDTAAAPFDFIAMPVPEPRAAALLVVVGAILFRRRARRRR